MVRERRPREPRLMERTATAGRVDTIHIHPVIDARVLRLVALLTSDEQNEDISFNVRVVAATDTQRTAAHGNP
jgi:hypothetical protein